MGDRSSIGWTDATWNPIRGCTRVSEGCRNCYAERQAIRHAYAQRVIGADRPGTVEGPYYGLVKSTPAGPRWTGTVAFVPEALDLPLRWRTPRRIFVNSMSDLFHERVEDEWIDRIWAVMLLTQRHTYQILTKRPERMVAYVTDPGHHERVLVAMDRLLGPKAPPGVDFDGSSRFPSPAIWLGVSVEDQATADARIPLLLQTPAAVRFVSYEPALGPVDFARYLGGTHGAEERGGAGLPDGCGRRAGDRRGGAHLEGSGAPWRSVAEDREDAPVCSPPGRERRR
jgi:protein gp37